MAYVANHLLEWGWLPFLTTDFGRILGIINFSLAATILVDAVWVSYDAEWFRSFGQLGLNLIAGAVAIRTYQVFPFDFSGYEFAWAPIARFLIIIGMVGIALGTIVELVKLLRRGLKAFG